MTLTGALAVLLVLGGPAAGIVAAMRLKRPETGDRGFRWGFGAALVVTVLAATFIVVVPLVD